MSWRRFVRDYKFYACRALDKAHVLEHLSFELQTRGRGRAFQIPIRSGIGYYNLATRHEAWMDALLSRLHARRAGACVDVGVNIGQTLLKIAALDENARYFGFEPNPVCYAYSRALVEANHLPHFKIFPVGLSSKSEVVTLFGDNEVASGASIVEDFRIDKSRFKAIHVVPVATAETVLAGEAIDAVNYIKIDVEGAELEVVEGARAILERFRPIVLMEILPVYSLDKPNGHMRKQRQDRVLELMRSLGYEMFLVREEMVKLEKLVEIGIHGDMKRTNYVFAPPGDSTFQDLR